MRWMYFPAPEPLFIEVQNIQGLVVIRWVKYEYISLAELARLHRSASNVYGNKMCVEKEQVGESRLWRWN